MRTGTVCLKHPGICGRRHNDGNCPACVKERRQADPSIPALSNKRWREANTEKVKELGKKWRDANPSKVKENNLKRTGFTLQTFNAMLMAQGYACAVCCVDLRTLTSKNVHADHCHSSGSPRGILCHYCNAGLGHFKDNPSLLRAAANYIEDKEQLW